MTFVQWLTEYEGLLKLQMELQPDLDGKKQQLDKYQVFIYVINLNEIVIMMCH